MSFVESLQVGQINYSKAKMCPECFAFLDDVVLLATKCQY